MAVWLYRAEMTKAEVIYDGVVEKVNVCPPFCVMSAEGVERAAIEKSPAIPVVAIGAELPRIMPGNGTGGPDTNIAHWMATPTRAGAVLLHVSVDAEDGVP